MPFKSSPLTRSSSALPANIRKTLEASNLPIETATAIADLCERKIEAEPTPEMIEAAIKARETFFAKYEAENKASGGNGFTYEFNARKLIREVWLAMFKARDAAPNARREEK